MARFDHDTYRSLNESIASVILSEATFKVPPFKSDNDIETIFDDGDPGSIEKNIIKVAKILVPLAGLTAKKIQSDPRSFTTAWEVLRKLAKDPSGDMWLGNFIDQTPEVMKVVIATLKSGGVRVDPKAVVEMGNIHGWASDSSEASWMPKLNDKKVKLYMKAYKGDYDPVYDDE